MVGENLRMRPADLSKPLELPPAPYLTKDDIAVAAQSVADAIAYRIASYAAKTRQLPTAVLRSYQEDVERAIADGRAHIFDGILSGLRTWADGFEPGSSRHEFAMARMRMALDLRMSFGDAARGRIARVLAAATEPMKQATPAPPLRHPAATAAAPTKADDPVAGTAARQALAQLQRAASRCAIWAWVHGAIFTLGLLITVSTISAASYAGGRYVVFWGAILFGAIGCIRNIVRYTKGKEAIAELERRIAAAR